MNIRKLLYLGLALLVLGGCSQANRKIITMPEPKREAGQTDMLQFKCDPVPIVRVGVIGLGMRGPTHVRILTQISDAKVTALCDLYEDRVERSQKILEDAGEPEAAEYYGEDGWKGLCKSDSVDLVLICTPWEDHTPMAVYAMEHGKHVAVEVPAATTVKECWELVDASEKSRKHCMMLENCCYDFFEMAALNMAQHGLFGDIKHVEGAYIHDLRAMCFNDQDHNGYQGYWRLRYNTAHTGNHYPTHGLGPVAQILNIHRGDRMEYLVSLSSDEGGLSEYASERFGPDSKEATTKRALGDMNTTLIHTVKGKSIMIQHDVSDATPYSRIYTIRGTRGMAQKYPVEGVAFDPDAEKFVTGAGLDSILSKWEHPLVRDVGEKAREVGGHGGMDYIMLYRLIYCLHNGLPLDEDVYDAAEWSCIGELSEISVKNGSKPVAIPDFTRGEWNKVDGFSLAGY
ncbi:MAG: Gfo/Idh/MocA family oxidoreductase [Bacteroidales bacterium]|jgi:predicted dehydrogenase|nr:Gfo/Idh/MocA family oxidoreductase [Bacteroidales bacterium]MCI2121465.1 Gfo/Idh/MocA family oxidoreductase [Bacteroidales bacterium]MCI2145262.1 Gfo/Idh/MocA family oxidoreductase [Bacteroidales bacterium]